MRDDLRLVSLREQIVKGSTRLFEVDSQLKEFCCSRDKDVESFIRGKAIRYERSGLSRTYCFSAGDFEANPVASCIAAYFSVAITSVDYTAVSKSRREKILGGTPGRINLNHFGGLLIAQLARDDRFDGSVISGAEMAEVCEEVIELGRDYLGGRVIYLDCKGELVPFYEKNDYQLLFDQPLENGFYKMAKALPKL